MIPLHERINYGIDPVKAKQGFGMGSSYVAEFYLYGKEFAQLFLGLFFGFFFNWFFKKFKKDNSGLVIIFLILPSLVYTPRHSLFFFIQASFVSMVILFVLFLLSSFKSHKFS